jgi:glycerophosphoryl diester phosphodiesterase
MRIFAHRGYHAEAPENTMAAFHSAARLGVDGIETDVRASRDGVPVLVHDRVMPDGQPVAELTQEELARAAAVPTLEQALTSLPDLFWNVEIKTPEALLPTLEVLDRYSQKERLLVTSFRHEVVLCCAATQSFACGLLLAHRPIRLGALLEECRPYPRLRTLVWDYNILDERLLREAREEGFGNVVYGALTPQEHRRCASVELVGLITDFPQYVPRQN